MRISRRAVIATLLALLPVLPVRGASWIVPGLANITGRNETHFSSDLVVLNRGSATTLLTFELTLLSGEPSPPPATRSVMAGETIVIRNVLSSLWGLSEQAGTARLSADQPLQITARTYNDADPAGTYGTAVQAIPHESLVLPGGVGHAPWVVESPDSSRGYRTNVGVFLALPGSSADIVLFDASGTELGRQTVTGGPRAFQTSVSSIVPGGIPLGRAELQVRDGKATLYTAVVDNVTGDGIAVQTVPVADRSSGPGALEAVINGVARSPGREGTFFQTDVRLFNESMGTATVTVTPLALATSTPATVSLAPGELKEIPDVLGTLFQLPDGAAGALRFTSASNVQVLARTSNVHRDGTPGTFGAFQRSTPVSTFLAPGSVGTLIGLTQTSDRPGYRTNAGFLAGPGGGAARLVLRDRSGTALATNETGVSLAGFGWIQPSLGGLFPDVPIPDGSTMEIVPTAGSLDVFASVIDNATGDPVVSGAEAFAPYFCPAPAVTSFIADDEVLAVPGTTALRWYSDADAAGIAPAGGSGLPGTGSVVVNPAATTTYRLTATNACGATIASVTVAVGGPAAPVPSVGSASPGQLVRLSPVNLARPDDVTGVVFTFPDGLAIRAEVETREASGAFVAVVPFQPDSGAAGGYRQGACTVSLEHSDLDLTPGAPFTISPFALPADPVAAFRTWLDVFVASARTKAAGITGFDGGNEALQALETLISEAAAPLYRAADGVGATGSAQLPIFPQAPGGPVPELVTLTRDQVAQICAYLDNLSAASKEYAGEVASRRALAALPCLKDELGMKFCYGAYFVSQAVDPSGRLLDNLNGLVGDVGLFPCGIGGVVGKAVLGVLDQLVNLAGLPTLICPILPNWLQGFRFRAVPNRVPVGVVTKVLIQAYLAPTADRSQLVSQVSQMLTEKLLDRFGRLSAECKKVIANFAALLSQFVVPYLQNAIDAVLARLNVPGLAPRIVAVGNCDLAEVTPNPWSVLLELAPDACPVQGDPHYCMRGRQPGGPAVLWVTPYSTSFLFPDERKTGVFRASLLNIATRPPYPVKMSVAGPPPGTTLANIVGDPSPARIFLDHEMTIGECDGYSNRGDLGSFSLEACWLAAGRWRVKTTAKGGPSSEASSNIRFNLLGSGLNASADSRIRAEIVSKGDLTTSPHAHFWTFDWTGRLQAQTSSSFGQSVANGPKSFSSGSLSFSLDTNGSFDLRQTLHAIVAVDPLRWPTEKGSFNLSSTIDLTFVERSQTAHPFAREVPLGEAEPASFTIGPRPR